MFAAAVLVLLWGGAVAQECPQEQKCLWKCCPFGYYINNTEGSITCESRPDLPELEVPEGVSLINHWLDCNDTYPLTENDKYHIKYTDSLLVYNGVQTKQFCLDRDDNKTVIYICFEDNIKEVEIVKKKNYLVYNISLFISVPFLLVTFVVYSMLQELKNFHGSCVKWHVLSNCMSYFLLALFMSLQMSGSQVCAIGGKRHCI